MTRDGGTGLMLNYSVDAEPSAPTPTETPWWQLFGVLNGTFRPFTGPLAVQGIFWIRTGTPFDFRVWAQPFEADISGARRWTQGKLLPETRILKALPVSSNDT